MEFEKLSLLLITNITLLIMSYIFDAPSIQQSTLNKVCKITDYSLLIFQIQPKDDEATWSNSMKWWHAVLGKPCLFFQEHNPDVTFSSLYKHK